MRRIGQIPPGVIMTGVDRKTGHLAGAIQASTLSRLIFVDLNRAIGMGHTRLDKAHEMIVVIVQGIRIILVAQYIPAAQSEQGWATSG